MLGKVTISREGGARKSGQNGVAKTGANIEEENSLLAFSSSIFAPVLATPFWPDFLAPPSLEMVTFPSTQAHSARMGLGPKTPVSEWWVTTRD